MIATPLQLVLCWYPHADSTVEASPPKFIDAAHRAFAGRSSLADDGDNRAGIPNWIAGTELRPVDIKRFVKPGEITADKLLNGALHTLVVAWVNETLLAKSPEFVKWLCQIWGVVAASNGRHDLLLGVPDERLRQALCDKAKKLGSGSLDNCQMRTWESLGEPAARPANVALRALEKARAGLTQGLGQARRNLRLFISHAKIDGLSLAESLTHAIKEVRGLDKFYDAQDIEDGDDWTKALQEGAESSVMIALRTDQYDERAFCVQEVAWADSAGAPIVVVEARSELFHPPSGLGLEGCPWVRIPDGSLTRILYCALRENLRVLLIRRGVLALGPKISKASVVLPRVPTWNSLDGALGRLPASVKGATYVVYPDPKLPLTTCEALDRFAEKRKKKVRVLNYLSLVAGAD
jgi:TIR domain